MVKVKYYHFKGTSLCIARAKTWMLWNDQRNEWVVCPDPKWMDKYQKKVLEEMSRLTCLIKDIPEMEIK